MLDVVACFPASPEIAGTVPVLLLILDSSYRSCPRSTVASALRTVLVMYSLWRRSVPLCDRSRDAIAASTWDSLAPRENAYSAYARSIRDPSPPYRGSDRNESIDFDGQSFPCP